MDQIRLLYGLVGDERLDVLVEQSTRKDLVFSVIPLERCVGLIRAVRINVRITALSRQRAGIESHARRHIGEIRTRHRASGGKTKDEVGTEIANGVDARQVVPVAAVHRDVSEVAESVLDLTRTADDIAGGVLVGAYNPKAGVPPPAARLQTRHGEAATDFLAH